MLRTIVILSIAFNVLLCNAQFISFNDGKFGVNFGGYHAEAGLGGLLTGNSAHGGLSASAGTPYGQRASAGIGGATGGNSQGGAYASASAGGNVGASAGLGAIAGGDAGLGAEAHTGPLTASASGAGATGFQVSTNKRIPATAVIQNSAAAADYNGNTNVIYRYDGGEFDGNVQAATNNNVVKETHIQRIKPPKKFYKINAQGHAHVAQPSNNVQIVEKAAVPIAPQQVIVTKEIEATPVIRTKVVSKTKTIQPAVVYQPVAPPSPSVYTGVGYTKTKSIGVGGARSGSGAGAATLSGNFNSQGLFDSIFNIPIQTLKAVNGLVNNVAGGVSGNIAVSKSVSASGSY